MLLLLRLGGAAQVVGSRVVGWDNADPRGGLLTSIVHDFGAGKAKSAGKRSIVEQFRESGSTIGMGSSEKVADDGPGKRGL